MGNGAVSKTGITVVIMVIRCLTKEKVHVLFMLYVFIYVSSTISISVDVLSV